MRKFYMIVLSLLIVSVSFAQFKSKTDARRGKEAPVKMNTNKLVLPKVIKATAKQAKAVNTTFFSEGFEGADLAATGWTAVDQDGDGENWTLDLTSSTPNSGSGVAVSASWTSAAGALTPNNYLISPAIDLTTATGTLFLDWFAAGQDPAWETEHYKVVLSTTGTAVTDFNVTLFEETLPTVGSTVTYFNRQANISAYAGQTIHIAFVHYNCTDKFRLNIDDISIYNLSTTDAGVTEIVAPNNNADCQLGATESVTVKITNLGGVDISNFPVSYTVNGGTPVTATCSQSIAPAASYDFTFPATADFSTLGDYTIAAYTSVPSDANAANDEASAIVHNSDAHVTIAMHTDSSSNMGWFVVNTLTGDTVAQNEGYQWNVDVTEEVCVYSDQCYQIGFFDADGGMDTYAWAAIYYNGTLVAGSTTPGSFTTSPLLANNVGSGCLATDGGVLGFVGLMSDCNIASITVEVGIKNFGTGALSNFPVSYIVNGGTPVTETVTSTIAPGDTLLYTFTSTISVSSAGWINLEAYTTIPGDGNASNDGAIDSLESISSVGVPYTSGFETNAELYGWTLENTNLDNSSWGIASGYGVGGGNAAACNYNSANAANDWLFTTCVDYTTGTTYKLDFQFRARSSSYPEKLEVKIGNDNNSTAMTDLLVDLGTVSDTVYALSSTQFTVNTAGTYYIGFHCYSDADMWQMLVDDVNIDIYNSVADVKESNISVYPNPVNDVLTVENAANSTINVYNVLGQVVYTASNVTNNHKIDMSNLVNGTYYVKVGSVTKKVTVVR